MEVHHHPHVEKKNFKEYLLEGLMIFLAVSMGFMAENIRERMSDRERLHDYMLSVTGDLKSDLALYDSAIAFNTRYSQTIDTIIHTLSSGEGDMGKVYRMARRLTIGGSSVISPDSKTFEQMKSSGGLRLIHKQVIADSIASYYLWSKKFDYWSDQQRQRINDMILANHKIFNARAFFDIAKNDNVDLPATLTLTSTDPKDINEVIMREQYYYGILKLMNQRALLASVQAKRLIDLLQKEYHLEKE